MGSSTAGEWLEKALLELCRTTDTAVHLDADLISGLVSYCDLASPPDAADYIHNIIGEEASKHVSQEYLRRRGYVYHSTNTPVDGTSSFRTYVKQPANEDLGSSSKKQTRQPKQAVGKDSSAQSIFSGSANISKQYEASGSRNTNHQSEASGSGNISKGNANHQNEASGSANTSKVNTNASKKKKGGKVLSLAEAAKGTVVFQKGKPCACQARRHKLVSNCLSCGKIVCEQEGEGPCCFCGALVLKEESTYAGLENTIVPVTEKEAAAEAFAKRLLEYDRNSAARTTVIDDQSDYYEIEGNTWLSKEEKDLLSAKQKEMEEAEKMRKSKVVVTFDLVGRKVLVNKDEASESESKNSLLRPAEGQESGRVKVNPTAPIQPVFVDTGSTRNHAKGRKTKRANGLCMEISGRVQNEENQRTQRNVGGSSDQMVWRSPQVGVSQDQDNHECSLDYN